MGDALAQTNGEAFLRQANGASDGGYAFNIAH